MEKIKVELTKHPKQKPQNESELGFGSVFSDHMFLMDYKEGKGWHNPRIVPYGNLSLDPAAMCLHYGQLVFEGMKAYRTPNGGINLFRPDENFKRMNLSNERLCIPKIDEAFCVEAVKKLVEIDKEWVPSAPNTSLYVRPFILCNEANLGVKTGEEYIFAIITSPSGPYYPEGLDPVKIYVEPKYVRTVRGGTGMAKTAGNYAASLIAGEEAHKEGYSQVLWLDGVEQKYVEEVGSMNIFFVIGDEIVTPDLTSGSILGGITRKSMIEILKKDGYRVSERKISMDEVAHAYDEGNLREVFGTGTAAVISPVGTLKYNDKVMQINHNEIGPISQYLYDTLTDMQWGRKPAPQGWIVKVC